MKGWQQIEAPHTPEGGSGIPLWRQRTKTGWVVVSGTGSVAFVPDVNTDLARDKDMWEPKIIHHGTTDS